MEVGNDEGAGSALERTCALQSRLRAAVQDLHPLTTSMDVDLDAAERERDALLHLTEQLELMEDRLREFRSLDPYDADLRAITLRHLEATRAELLDAAAASLPHVVFSKEALREIVAFANGSGGGHNGMGAPQSAGGSMSGPPPGFSGAAGWGAGALGGTGDSFSSRLERKEAGTGGAGAPAPGLGRREGKQPMAVPEGGPLPFSDGQLQHEHAERISAYYPPPGGAPVADANGGTINVHGGGPSSSGEQHQRMHHASDDGHPLMASAAFAPGGDMAPAPSASSPTPPLRHASHAHDVARPSEAAPGRAAGGFGAVSRSTPYGSSASAAARMPGGAPHSPTRSEVAEADRIIAKYGAPRELPGGPGNWLGTGAPPPRDDAVRYASLNGASAYTIDPDYGGKLRVSAAASSAGGLGGGGRPVAPAPRASDDLNGGYVRRAGRGGAASAYSDAPRGVYRSLGSAGGLGDPPAASGSALRGSGAALRGSGAAAAAPAPAGVVSPAAFSQAAVSGGGQQQPGRRAGGRYGDTARRLHRPAPPRGGPGPLRRAAAAVGGAVGGTVSGLCNTIGGAASGVCCAVSGAVAGVAAVLNGVSGAVAGAAAGASGLACDARDAAAGLAVLAAKGALAAGVVAGAALLARHGLEAHHSSRRSRSGRPLLGGWWDAAKPSQRASRPSQRQQQQQRKASKREQDQRRRRQQQQGVGGGASPLGALLGILPQVGGKDQQRQPQQRPGGDAPRRFPSLVSGRKQQAASEPPRQPAADGRDWGPQPVGRAYGAPPVAPRYPQYPPPDITFARG